MHILSRRVIIFFGKGLPAHNRGSQGQALGVFEKQFLINDFFRVKILFQKTLTAALSLRSVDSRKKIMTQLPHKKKISFAIASLFEGTQNITYFDSEGNPIRKAQKKKSKPISKTDQTSLL